MIDLVSGRLVAVRPLAGDRSSYHDLAFSEDGKALAVVLDNEDKRVGPSSTVFSMVDGATTDGVRTSLPRHTMRTTFDGKRLLWLPSGSGWLLMGRYIVDRETGDVRHDVGAGVNRWVRQPTGLLNDRQMLVPVGRDPWIEWPFPRLSASS